MRWTQSHRRSSRRSERATSNTRQSTDARPTDTVRSLLSARRQALPDRRRHVGHCAGRRRHDFSKPRRSSSPVLPNDPLNPTRSAELEEIGPIGCITVRCSGFQAPCILSSTRPIGKMGGLDVPVSTSPRQGPRAARRAALQMPPMRAGTLAHGKLDENVSHKPRRNPPLFGAKAARHSQHGEWSMALSPVPRSFDTCALRAARGGVIALEASGGRRLRQAWIRSTCGSRTDDTPMAARAGDGHRRCGATAKANRTLAKDPGNTSADLRRSGRDFLWQRTKSRLSPALVPAP